MNKRIMPILCISLILFVTACQSPVGGGTDQNPPTPRSTDFTIFGNSLGWDLNATASGLVTTGLVDGAGATNTSDEGIDLYWRSDSPGEGQAVASTAVSMVDARSSASLVLPAGAKITYARLYWAAYQLSGGIVDETVTIERPNGPSVKTVSADKSWKLNLIGGSSPFWYQCAADITQWLAALGTGVYRLSGVSSILELNSTTNAHAMAGWSVVVYYNLPSDPARALVLKEGLLLLNSSTPQTIDFDGFSVPFSGFDAKLGVIAYSGDNSYSDDMLRFGPTSSNLQLLYNGANPFNNFFNSSRSIFGSAVGNSGDLPLLSGGPGSMCGMDLDIVDVTSMMQAGQSSAVIKATTNIDIIALGVFVFSVTSTAP